MIFKAGVWVREGKRLGLVVIMSGGNLHIEWEDGVESIVPVETAREALIVVEVEDEDEGEDEGEDE